MNKSKSTSSFKNDFERIVEHFVNAEHYEKTEKNEITQDESHIVVDVFRRFFAADWSGLEDEIIDQYYITVNRLVMLKNLLPHEMHFIDLRTFV